MKRTNALIKTYKETPSDADSINASLLTRAGFIQKQIAGVYALLPLGMRVYKKIEQIIREEMNAISGEEMDMNVLQPKELWDETGRWNELDEILYKLKDKSGSELLLGPTHEEQITDIIRHHISSYKHLPRYLYQFQTKFRNEARARSGLLRGREFIMKDLYSFHVDEKDFNQYYEKIKKAYLEIFSRCSLEVKIVEADGGSFSKFSHEFQVITKTGEDTILYCDKCDFAQNKEIAEVNDGDSCPKCDGKVVKASSIEVGNIFPLKNKFSIDMNAKFKDKDGNEKNPIMGCYGIGLTRVLGTLVEVYNDKRGIIWPESVAPYKVNLITIDKYAEADNVYEALISKGVEVLYDDRDDVTAGEKFADADLIGCPVRVIVSDKSITAGGAEISRRGKEGHKIVKIEDVTNKLTS